MAAQQQRVDTIARHLVPSETAAAAAASPAFPIPPVKTKGSGRLEGKVALITGSRSAVFTLLV